MWQWASTESRHSLSGLDLKFSWQLLTVIHPYSLSTSDLHLTGGILLFFLSRCLLVCIHLTFNFHNFPVLTSHQNSPLQSQVFSFTFLILITNQAGFHYIILLPTFMPRNWASTIQQTQPTHGDHISNKQTLTSKKACTQCNVKSSLKVWLHIKILFDNPQHHHSPLLTSWPDKVRKLENVISVQMLRTMQKLNSGNCSNISDFSQKVDGSYIVACFSQTRWFSFPNIINTS